MGFFDADYSVGMAQGAVVSAQRMLEDARANLATAKNNGNYKRALKNINYKGKKGNTYDYNVWCAQDNLAEMRKRLSDAKAKARAEKAKSAKEAREAKAEAAREAREAKAEAAREAREAKAEAAREAREAKATRSDKESSSSRSSSSSSRRSSSYDEDVSREKVREARYGGYDDSDRGNGNVRKSSSGDSTNPIIKFFKDLYAPIFSSVGNQMKSNIEKSFDRAFNPFKKR